MRHIRLEEMLCQDEAVALGTDYDASVLADFLASR